MNTERDTVEQPDDGDFLAEDEVAHVVEDEGAEPMSEDDDAGGASAEDDDDIDEDGEGAEGSAAGGEEIAFVDDSVQGFFDHREPVYAVSLHPSDPTLAASGGGDDRSYLWRIDTGDKVFDLGVHTDSVVAVRFSSDGQFVASGGMDGKLFVFRVDTGKLVQTLEGPSEITWIDWHPKGNVILAGSEDGSVWMWQIPSGNCMNVFTGHVEPVTCGQFTPDGKLIITGSADGSLIIWDPKTATALHRFTPQDSRFHQSAITALAINKDSTLILSASQDGTARLLHINGRILASLDSHQDSVEAAGFSNHLPYAATGSVDGKINIWDITSMRLRQSVQHEDAVIKLQWHQNAPLLTSCSSDMTVRSWDGRSGECLKIWRGHQSPILDFSVRGDGGVVLTGSDDGTALVFQA
ncbi:60S ribosomal subunit assembly or modification protein [Polyrhizophydium stewartii]|uniref:60S ribosomal subunit assembly or modification protein n=1 Tax=Polyrhizophydium stewartii TaxID=2732419 RepID=A0ABR4MW79_9FUNG